MTTWRQNLESIAVSVLVVCAVVSTGAFLHRSYSAPQEPQRSAVYRKYWREMKADGQLIGREGAPLTVIEFGDFQCPWCARFHEVVSEERRTDDTSLALIYVHAISPTHTSALPAARASECAGNQGRFAAYHDVLFRQQDSLGIKLWVNFAKEAGVPDLVKFERCNIQSGAVPHVDAGLKWGQRAQIAGTPTVIVNGWQLNWVPTQPELHRMIELVRSGRTLSERELVTASQ